MKIKSIETFPVRKKKDYVYLGGKSGAAHPGHYYFRPEYRCIYGTGMETLFVRIITDTGLVGWGEALTAPGPTVACAVIDTLLSPILLGMDPLDTDVIWNRLFNSMRDRGFYTGFMLDAITAVDVALWSIKGQYFHAPVYKLIGGAYRTEIPVYVSGLPVETLEEKVDLALQWKEKGFQAIKLQIGYGIKEDVRIMKALRDALGPDYTLMIDAHWHYTVPEAIKLGREMEALDVAFLECPTNPEDVEANAEIAHALDIAVALGESERTRFRFKEYLIHRAADIYQPDIGRNGITESKKIADMAEVWGIPIAPHLSVGLGLCILSTLHLAAAIPNFYMQEFQPSILPVANEFSKTPIVCEDGKFVLSDAPGFGIEIDEDEVRKYCIK